MSKKTEKIYIVKFKSTEKKTYPKSRYSSIYSVVAVIDTGGDIKQVIEGVRVDIQTSMQDENTGIEIVTTVSDIKKFNVLTIMCSKED